MTELKTPPSPPSPQGEPLPGGEPFGGPPARGTRPIDYRALQEHPDFVVLRSRLRRFVFPMCALFLAWYFGYVLMAAYLPHLMAHRLTGSITVGLVLGLGQFVTTLAITTAYVRYAARRLDPQVDRLRRIAAGPSAEEADAS